MGRILAPAAITQQNVQDYIRQSTKDYSTFLRSTPVFCTYYSKSSFGSNHDRSLENFSETVGADSPLKFDRVENLPIYSVENASFGTEITDFGISGTVTSTAILLPDTVIPMPDDVFELSFQTEKRVFLVTDVEQDNFNNSRYYKITFKLSQFSVQEVEDQVERELTVDYHLIGKSRTPVVEKSSFDLYVRLEGLCDSLIDEYRQRYYDQSVGLYADTEVDPLGRLVCDPMLNCFILNHELCNRFESYRSFVFVDPRLKSLNRTRSYARTVFGVFERGLGTGLGSLELNVAIPIRFSVDRYSKDWFSKRTHYTMEYVESSALSDVVAVLPGDIVDSVQAGTPPSEPSFRRLLVRAIAGEYSRENFHEIPEDIGLPDYSVEDYYTIPLTLFVLRKVRELIIDKPGVV